MKLVRLWKEDIVKSFEQLKLRARNCHIMLVRIDPDLDMVFICGNFGYTSMPFAFGVLTRALSRVCDRRLRGRALWYCDDAMGAGSESEEVQDQIRTQKLIVNAFGSGGWSEEKSVKHSTTAELIGWYVDTTLGTVRPNDKGVRKTLLRTITG